MQLHCHLWCPAQHKMRSCAAWGTAQRAGSTRLRPPWLSLLLLLTLRKSSGVAPVGATEWGAARGSRAEGMRLEGERPSYASHDAQVRRGPRPCATDPSSREALGPRGPIWVQAPQPDSLTPRHCHADHPLRIDHSPLPSHASQHPRLSARRRMRTVTRDTGAGGTPRCTRRTPSVRPVAPHCSVSSTASAPQTPATPPPASRVHWSLIPLEGWGGHRRRRRRAAHLRGQHTAAAAVCCSRAVDPCRALQTIA
jgi:hypothetical protein